MDKTGSESRYTCSGEKKAFPALVITQAEMPLPTGVPTSPPSRSHPSLDKSQLSPCRPPSRDARRTGACREDACHCGTNVLIADNHVIANLSSQSLRGYQRLRCVDRVDHLVAALQIRNPPTLVPWPLNPLRCDAAHVCKPSMLRSAHGAHIPGLFPVCPWEMPQRSEERMDRAKRARRHSNLIFFRTKNAGEPGLKLWVLRCACTITFGLGMKRSDTERCPLALPPSVWPALRRAHGPIYLRQRVHAVR